jgi:hypothetical protein
MTVQCIDCQRLNLRDAPKMARLGFGGCEREARGTYKSVVWARECVSFRPMEAANAAKRREWYQQKQ